MSFSEIHFLSDSLKQGVSAAVFMPERGPFGSDARPPYRTVYLLPGYSGDYPSIYTMLGIRKQAELKGLVVVIPNGRMPFMWIIPKEMPITADLLGRSLLIEPEICSAFLTKEKTPTLQESQWEDTERS
ncbi:hypothetical protein [Butyrivibrio sp. FCS014]|uniref:hypothetical protein n=1 Tax=Butyrivibrio sp. FCS014 TaxID=1408304 RepID=UPI001FA7F555|nr:hypothetical protein [Butyrivibrio sp. FCS014]